MQTHASLLPATWRIPDELRDRLGDRPGRQRVMEADGHLLLVLHAPPQPDQVEREGRYFWRQPDGTWSAVGGPGGPGALVSLLDEYDSAIAKLDQMEEVAHGARDYFEVLNGLTPLARSARNLYETLQAARQAARDDRRLILARDRAYSLSRTAEILDTDARNALDFAIARRAEQQAASSHQMAVASHRLNLLVAFFFPIATLSAIFGTNLRHGLAEIDEAAGPLPLLAMVAIGMFLGVALTIFVTRQAPAPSSKNDRGTTGPQSKK
jgi:hypothetical protein